MISSENNIPIPFLYNITRAPIFAEYLKWYLRDPHIMINILLNMYKNIKDIKIYIDNFRIKDSTIYVFLHNTHQKLLPKQLLKLLLKQLLKLLLKMCIMGNLYGGCC